MSARTGTPAWRSVPISLLAAAALVASAATAVSAEYQDTEITEGWSLSRPSLAVRQDDSTFIAFQRTGSDAGLIVADDAGGSWATQRLTTGDDWYPDLALDATGAAHIAYVRYGADATISYATDASSAWASTPVQTERDAGAPAIAVDAAGKVHVVYAAYGFTPGIYHLTNASGAWVRTQVTSATHDWEPDVAIDGAGVVHIVFARYAPESRGIYHYYGTGAGPWSSERLTSGLDDYPALALDRSDKAHVVFTRYSEYPETLRYATNAGGAWVTAEDPVSWGDLDGWFGPPSIAFDPAGTLQAAAEFHDVSSHNDNATVSRYALEPDGWHYYTVPSPAAPDDGDPSLGFTSDGQLRLAFGRTSPNAGIELYVAGTATTAVAASQRDTFPSLAPSAAGERRLAFQRRATAGELMLGSEQVGWSFESAGSAPVPPSATDLAVAPDDTARLVTGSTLATNMTGDWLTFDQLGYGNVESAVAIDATGLAHVVTGYHHALLYRQMPGVAEYAWPCYPSVTCVGGEEIHDFYPDVVDPHPDIALSTSGRPYVAATISGCVAVFRRDGPGDWAFVEPVVGHFCGESGPDRWPAIAVDGSGKIHLAYEQLAGDGSTDRSGIYYATNASGAWVNRLVSRSSADGPPSIALDKSGKVYIAFARRYWAVRPGVYLATNETGSWTTTQLTSDFSAANPTVSIGADGTVDIAYGSGGDALWLLDELAPGSTGASTPDHRAGGWATLADGWASVAAAVDGPDRVPRERASGPPTRPVANPMKEDGS